MLTPGLKFWPSAPSLTLAQLPGGFIHSVSKANPFLLDVSNVQTQLQLHQGKLSAIFPLTTLLNCSVRPEG